MALIKSKNTDILTCDRKRHKFTHIYTDIDTHATYTHKIDDDTKSWLAKRCVKRVVGVGVVLSISQVEFKLMVCIQLGRKK